MPELLHPELLTRIPVTGRYITAQLQQRVGEAAVACQGLPDPDVSVVIRAKNNAGQLAGLLEDIAEQDFNGGVELLVVDTESTDKTRDVARAFGAAIIPMEQQGFSYPKALNKGFEAASNDAVFSLVDHSRLVSDHVLRMATRWGQVPALGGVSGITLPNSNASAAELTATALVFPGKVKKVASVAGKISMGFLSTNCSLISREAWRAAGSFDEAYGAGGEDLALAYTLLDSGFTLVEDPAMSVHHTHGTGWIDSVRQVRYWKHVMQPHGFDLDHLARHRAELRNTQE